ncbi:MAG: FixH family protein [Acidobacteriota bacterium]
MNCLRARWIKANLTTPLLWVTLLIILPIMISQLACSKSEKNEKHAKAEEEAESRTEFTSRIENFFEYEPLKANKKSQFLIHLTDLSDGSPVEKADVMLTIRSKGVSSEVAQTKARVGKVTGIYVADVTIPNPGNYDIEFQVKNEKLDERMPLTDFKVE